MARVLSSANRRGKRPTARYGSPERSLHSALSDAVASDPRLPVTSWDQVALGGSCRLHVRFNDLLGPLWTVHVVADQERPRDRDGGFVHEPDSWHSPSVWDAPPAGPALMNLTTFHSVRFCAGDLGLNFAMMSAKAEVSMLSILGKTVSHCDGITRRRFLTAGALTIGGLTLADLLQAEAASGLGSSTKAVINLHLDGGPPQMDLVDLKPDAPAEIRGEFSGIDTSIPGFQICELMPKVAQIANRFAVIRSLVGSTGQHNAFQCQSGWDEKNLAAVGGRPAMGCVVSKLHGSPKDIAPCFVDLMQGRAMVRDSARPGFLGPSYKPFRPDISQLFARPLEAGMKNELAKRGDNHTVSLKLDAALNAERLDDRAGLLGGLDTLRRLADRTGMMDAMDRFHRQATEILLSGEFAEALDLARVPAQELARYTAPASSLQRFTTAEDEHSMRKLLLARRLVQAGVRCVSVSFSDFDTHTNNFGRMRQMLPILDHGLHTLITDLDEHGMLRDVAIVVWGEFGRTPKINDQAGRDHWPRVGMCLLAGGGLRVGQVIGATDRTASTATSRPVTYQDVLATLYHHLGIDTAHTTVTDPAGRPQYLLDQGQPLSELV